MNFLIRWKVLAATLLFTTPISADIWDDSGNSVSISFQIVIGSEIFDQQPGEPITARGLDANLVAVTNASWSTEVFEGTEMHRRLWICNLTDNRLISDKDSVSDDDRSGFRDSATEAILQWTLPGGSPVELIETIRLQEADGSSIFRIEREAR